MKSKNKAPIKIKENSIKEGECVFQKKILMKSDDSIGLLSVGIAGYKRELKQNHIIKKGYDFEIHVKSKKYGFLATLVLVKKSSNRTPNGEWLM